MLQSLIGRLPGWPTVVTDGMVGIEEDAPARRTRKPKKRFKTVQPSNESVDVGFETKTHGGVTLPMNDAHTGKTRSVRTADELFPREGDSAL